MISVFIKTRHLLAPVSGRSVPLKAADSRGIAIIPADTVIFAPVDGTLVLKEGSGLDIFVNFSRGTIELRGKFKCSLKSGSRVNAGDAVAAIDLDLLKNGGYMTQVRLTLPKNAAARPIDTEWVKGGESPVIKIDR